MRGGLSGCTRRKLYCSRPAPCSTARVLLSIGNAGWWWEHRLARLVQLGIRQSRYFGRIKTRFQLYLAATVANLTLVAAKAGFTGKPGFGSSADSALAAEMGNSAANSGAAWLGQIWALILLAATLLPKSLFPTRGLFLVLQRRIAE